MNLLQPVVWAKVGLSVAIFAGAALLLSLFILLVFKLCKTRPDERTEQVLSHLAGANCGGCGYSGCAAFAQKLVAGEARLSDCHVTSDEKKKEICARLGLNYQAARPTVSVCRCNGGERAKNAYSYVGANDCVEQNKLYGGAKRCKVGCLGNGNCAVACPTQAITLPDGYAEVNAEKCVSCGACLFACPKELFTRIPADAKVYVACSSHEKGNAVLDVCEVGCIACGRCAKVCPVNAITMKDNLPQINYEICVKCGKCAESCPRHTILLRY